MKTYFLILISLLVLTSCSQRKQDSAIVQTSGFYPEVEQRTLIVGQIDNFLAFKDAPKNIELSITDIAINNHHSYNLEIDDSGKFIFDIPLYNPMISHLKYGDSFIAPYLFPNDTILLNFSLYKDGYKFKHRYIRYDKKRNKFQKTFKRYHQLVFHRNRNFRKTIESLTEVQKIKAEYLGFEKAIEEKIKNISLEDSLGKDLSNYLVYHAKYSTYNELIRTLHKNEKETNWREFLSFLDDSVIFNKDAIICADYQIFLNSYFNLVERHFDTQDSLCSNEEYNTLEALTNQVEQCFKLRKGIWAEFLAASYLYKVILKEELDQSLKSSYSELIKKYFEDIYIRQLLLSTLNSDTNKNDIVKEKSIPKGAKLKKYSSFSGEDLLDKIISENKGKVIYIDIWATWCSPCKRQIPHSIRLHKMFHKENVSFVYLCCRSEEETWKNVIRQHQIKGDHILLSKEQNDYLKTKFSITGIPRYLLIDKNGEIVSTKAPRPDSDEIVKSIRRILQY